MMTILFPIGVLSGWFSNIKAVYRDMILGTWQCKKYGSFSSDVIYERVEGDNTFKEVLKARKNS